MVRGVRRQVQKTGTQKFCRGMGEAEEMTKHRPSLCGELSDDGRLPDLTLLGGLLQGYFNTKELLPKTLSSSNM